MSDRETGGEGGGIREFNPSVYKILMMVFKKLLKLIIIGPARIKVNIYCSWEGAFG